MNSGWIKTTGSTFLILIVVLLTGGCVTTNQLAQKGAVNRARAAMAEGNYEFALQRLEAAETYDELQPDNKAELLYLKGVCHENLNQPAKARQMFGQAAEKFPETSFGKQAKQKMAVP
ncbi:MAG TPA: hypothetical protein VK327_02500 [Candidatus Paceibacterota bacterium]|nr:hypothetical protein [Candidatus Paceibacterota bacterium]